MKAGIMQPYFFPYIGYWQLMNEVDIYVIYDDVNYINRGWINRNRILIDQKAKYIHLPLCSASQNKLINEIDLMDSITEKQKLLRTLKLNYAKAPCFQAIYPLLEKIIQYHPKKAIQFLEYQLRLIAEFLSIKPHFLLSSEIHKNNALKGEDKILEICKILGADTYVNAIGGQALYSQEKFCNAGIQLQFLKTEEISYPQFSQKFVPNLSIIDVMMFNSKENIEIMLKKFSLL